LKPLPGLPSSRARKKKAGNLTRLHGISPDLILGFLKVFSFKLFTRVFYFLKEDKSNFSIDQVAKERNELTIEAFRLTKEEELILYREAHFLLISCSSNAKHFSRP